MRRLGSVQRKMPCVFVTEVKEEPSTKREHQVIRVEGPAGAAARRLLSGALVAFEPGERAWLCRSRLIGRELFPGFVWGTGGGGWREGRGGVSHTLSSRFFSVAMEKIFKRIFLSRRFKLALARKLKTHILSNISFFLGCRLLEKNLYK